MKTTHRLHSAFLPIGRTATIILRVNADIPGPSFLGWLEVTVTGEANGTKERIVARTIDGVAEGFISDEEAEKWLLAMSKNN